MTLTYQPNPGLYSDVIFSHTLYFNIETPDNLENFINPKKRAADMRCFREALTKFEEPSDELCPFFEVVDKRSFAFSKMYVHMSRTQDFSLESLKTFLPDAKTMVREVFAFFLPENVLGTDDALKKVKNSLASLNVSPLVKFHLLGMLVEPQPYYDALFASLEKRVTEMKAYYKANRAVIDATQKSIKEEEITELLEKCYAINAEDMPEKMEYSVMLIGKNAVRFVGGETPFIILGYDYSARMAMLIAESIQPDIVKIGKAISEEKRVTILQLLLAENEITAQQLLRRLELSMTATHYHLEMLMQAGMLLARNEGRTIYYSLNREFFDRAPIVFEKFNSKENYEI